MAGFALSSRILFDHPYLEFKGKQGLVETLFLEQFVDNLTKLEPKAYNCSKVWH